MQILRNIGTLATCPSDGAQADIGLVHDAAIAWNGDEIIWAGRAEDLPANLGTAVMFDARGALVVPGLVDCHTHLAFGGWRADEFEQRARGATYQEIARSGGGIAATVRATRQSTRDELTSRSRGFLDAMSRLGVTTVECKSGYGLDLEHELLLLRVYQRLAEQGPTRLVTTLLAAHAVPAEYRENRAGYVDLIINEIIPAVAREELAHFCDVFVEEGAFTPDEARGILAAGARAGLRPKLHADQLSDGGGAQLAAELDAASADHLEHASDEGIAAMARKGVVAVSLPLASLYLRQPFVDARRLMEAGVRVAVATDFNPGSAPTFHLPLAMTLACTSQGMTPAEALKGATIVAARAIGMDSEVGSLEPGKRADFAVINAESVNQWLYHFQPNSCRWTVVGGRTVWKSR